MPEPNRHLRRPALTELRVGEMVRRAQRLTAEERLELLVKELQADDPQLTRAAAVELVVEAGLVDEVAAS